MRGGEGSPGAGRVEARAFELGSSTTVHVYFLEGDT